MSSLIIFGKPVATPEDDFQDYDYQQSMLRQIS